MALAAPSVKPDYIVAETAAKFYGEGENTQETWKIALQHNIDDNIMVYASLATGNKPGGATPDQYGDPTVFAPEEVDSFEIGLRSILMDGALLMNLTAFSMDFQDAHYSQVVGSAAITNSLDYTHKGVEGQMKLFLSDSTSIDFNFLALDSTIGDGESLFNPLNPNGASQLLDVYNLTVEADIGRLAAALDAAVTAGTISATSLLLPNPIVNGTTLEDGTVLTCAQLVALGLDQGIGCNPYLGGTGASYLALITGNEDAAALLPFALFANTDAGFIASFQGFKLSFERWMANDTLSALPLPWLASSYMVDLGGTRTPYTAELDYNIALNHSMPLFNGNLDLRFTYTVKGDTNGDLFSSMNTFVPEQEYIDIYGN